MAFFARAGIYCQSEAIIIDRSDCRACTFEHTQRKKSDRGVYLQAALTPRQNRKFNKTAVQTLEKYAANVWIRLQVLGKS